MDKQAADNEVRARLAANDPSALEMIWNLYSSDLLGYLVGMSCSRHEAEDALQDVFLMIVRKQQYVAKARHIKPYLFRLARNVALNRISRSKRLRKQADAAPDWLTSRDTGQKDARTKQLASALAALPPKQRTVLILKFFRDKTLREVGELLGISENTAGSRYRYGMAKLRDLMQRESS